MHAPNLLAAALAVSLSSMFDTLVHIVGTVIIIASVLWSGYCLLAYLARRSAPAAPAPLPANQPLRATPRPAEPAQPGSAIPDHIVAVIAAAVYSALDDKHRIISIKPQDSSWEKAGRQAILTSHRIR